MGSAGWSFLRQRYGWGKNIVSQGGGLIADIGDGDTFPGIAFARWPQRPQPRNDLLILVTQMPVGIDGDPEADGVSRHDTTVAQCRYQRVFNHGIVAEGTGAVDDIGGAQGAGGVGMARLDGEADRCAVLVIIDDSPRADGQLWCGCNHCGDLRGNAMAINVPVGTDMPQEATFFVERPMYPQLLIVGAQRMTACHGMPAA